MQIKMQINLMWQQIMLYMDIPGTNLVNVASRTGLLFTLIMEKKKQNR